MRTVKLKRETLIAALVKFFFYCCRNIISYIILSKKGLVYWTHRVRYWIHQHSP